MEITNIYADHFWNWFRQNKHQWKHPEEHSKEKERYLSMELRVHLIPCLGYFVWTEVWVDKEKEEATLVLTSLGIEDHFDAIEEMVWAAPAIEGWNIVALRPPMPPVYGIKKEFPGVTITDTDMFFAPLELMHIDGKYDVHVYVRQTADIDEELEEAVSQVVYNILGERRDGLFLNEVPVSNFAEASPETQKKLLPLVRLVDFIPTGMVVDEDGEITNPLA